MLLPENHDAGIWQAVAFAACLLFSACFAPIKPPSSRGIFQKSTENGKISDSSTCPQAVLA
ncbi:hypothetical protein TMES_11450 [Thalassospira mesophila]|uniref:Uncharacterized protein n=1 Tax=Thalassospira mesophila TaxID=1293891 RepID=A0A1Y2L006_9PROT|nr:hypothetical protein TMES_11450 [Thalassospira mesophila]